MTVGDSNRVLPASGRERVRTLVLLSALVAALVGVVYVAETPSGGPDPFTEFYILGPDGNATDYPTNLTVGETGSLTVGVRNNELRTVRYTVVAQIDNRTVEDRTLTLADDEREEWPVTFEARSPGRHRLRLLLFKDEADQPVQDLRLWVTVAEQP